MLQETVYLFPNGIFVFGHHVTVYLLIFENGTNVAVTIWFPSQMRTENFPGGGGRLPQSTNVLFG